MSITPESARVIILVKALPQPSKLYGETVCCAGVTADGIWKRLYPIRFRHLQGKQSFSRWNWVGFKYREPTRDKRPESSHVYEESIAIEGMFAEKDRPRFLNRLVVGSARLAAEAGRSAAPLIRPHNTRFTFKPKSAVEIEDERDAYRAAGFPARIIL